MSKYYDLQRDLLLAETICSQGYRNALNDDFASNPETFVDHRRNIQQLILGSFALDQSSSMFSWELRRQTVLAELTENVELGLFREYVNDLGGVSEPASLTKDDLGQGSLNVVRTNNRIVALAKLQNDPIDFLLFALEKIDRSKKSAGLKSKNIGPENYATALKLFADKYIKFDSDNLDQAKMSEAISSCLDGFEQVIKKDKPNFVEMTNIYFAIMALPQGTFNSKYSKMIAVCSLEQLPFYNKHILSLLVSCLGKLDLKDVDNKFALIIDLALRKNNHLETTKNYRDTLRAIAGLPLSADSNRVFRTFLDVRSKLEKPLDIEGLEEVNFLLHKIVDNVIDDPDLSSIIKDLAYANTIFANELLEQIKKDGTLTPRLVADYEKAVSRITAHYTRI